ncbi:MULTISPECIES: glutamate racemase [Ralstonia solanacearum species complex]|uniref:glutamate racemase n=1 Tax=Ralstonia solanacearum species complex TaxID=3116862 RepID=UPI000E57709A|nr:glutamate racemase [Ralstonia solanacearum]BEU71760.1 glutamate racemase [Ralstonia pseudosolanacearum]AXV76695.1 glutamate racemase [Ralstonia solanacearum]AXV90704.1 glutamate racemase [Ralstonia solanacearum]AXW18869.1 glutamate racemase [Ralstonia solanacearum]AXW61783.1 glutamate racemase [Ralstonia solanacearum]
MTARAQAPVGVFDSGLGGLSVLRAIRAELPAESLLYLADSRHAPYGEKSPQFIAERTLRVCGWLVGQGCKALVIACNTATAQAVHLLREQLAVPVIGVEPGLKPAAATSRSRVVGVLATESTLRSDKFARLLGNVSGDCRVLCQPGYGLVPLIERGDTHSPAVLELLQAYLQPMLEAGADTLVLGCTHYPFLQDAIREIAGDRLTLIDTGHAVARHLGRTLAAAQLQATSAAASPRFLSTADVLPLQAMVAALLGEAPMAQRVDIGDATVPPLASPP